MIIKILQDKINGLDAFIKPTIEDKKQFETNIRNAYTAYFLAKKLEFIQAQREYIGKEVFKFKKNFSVTSIEEFNINPNKHFNPIEDTSFVYTQEDYELFVKKYISYQIEYLTSDLIKNTHHSYSTNPLSNLASQWITECKQNLIEFLSEIKLS